MAPPQHLDDASGAATRARDGDVSRARRAAGGAALLALIGVAGAADEAQPTSPAGLPPTGSAATYDPLRGIDRSGRIPKVALPDDVPNPERWRYIPEGRIKPGSIIERFFVTTFVSPIVYHQEDIGTGGGIALSDIDFRGQRRREFIAATASRSTEGEEEYGLFWKRALDHRDMPDGGVIVEERSYVDGRVNYTRSRTRRFFGLGPDTTADDETSFTDEVSTVLVQAGRSLPDAGSDWVVDGGVRGVHHNLARGRVHTRPTTGEVFPTLVASGDGRDALWLAAGARYDTRDSQHQPYHGMRVGYAIDAAPAQSGGDVGAIHTVDASGAIPIPSFFHDGGDHDEANPPTDTIALGGFVEAAQGDLAFYDLPSLGGADTLRGYIANRFTGRAAWHASAEWRFWPVPRGFALTDAVRLERLGMALFYDIGAVADHLDELARSRVRDSYGVGFRAAFERTAVFRIDLGWSHEGMAVTAQFGLPF